MCFFDYVKCLYIHFSKRAKISSKLHGPFSLGVFEGAFLAEPRKWFYRTSELRSLQQKTNSVLIEKISSVVIACHQISRKNQCRTSKMDLNQFQL